LRGGTQPSRLCKQCVQGLSPLARGNRRPISALNRSMGSIPACAGEPMPTPSRCGASRVYPRLRGGTCTAFHPLDLDYGLSPLARGNHSKSLEGAVRGGSIPACAGEPHPSAPSGRVAGVYPRLRGGTVPALPVTLPVTGLSPLARGNRGKHPLKPDEAGSIPACAGEPQQSGEQCGLTRVYPRLRGGTRRFGARAMDCRGLSPLARGNHRAGRHADRAGGSIPACAGEPACTRSR